MSFLRTHHTRSTTVRGHHVAEPTGRHAAGSDTAVGLADDAAGLRVSQLCLYYPDGKNSDGSPRRVTALDHVDFEAEPGTMTAVTGPSGSGKSSLLAVCSTLVAPSSGTVSIAGHRVDGLSAADAARLRREQIGTVFQQPNLLPSLTCEEQLTVTAHIRGARGAELRRARGRARELLSIVGLEQAAQRRPHELSGGQRQRVNIARALMGEPSVLLVDEPTSALDQHRSEEIMRLLVEVTERFRLATVVVTHDLEYVTLADRRVHMVDGRLGQP